VGDVVVFPGNGNEDAAPDSSAKLGSCQASIVTADIIKRAQAVIERLEGNLRWDTEWRDLILALGTGRDQALRTGKTEKPQGPKYRAAMGVWLRCYGFDRIDEADRSRLISCYDNLAAINAWRSALPAGKQEKLNHPRTVLARWKRSLHPEPVDNSNVEPAPQTITITVDAVLTWLATTKLSPADRARVIEALAITRADVPAAVQREIGEHAVEQQNLLADREAREGLLVEFHKNVKAAVATRGHAAHQIAHVQALLESLDGRIARTFYVRDNLAPESHFKFTDDKDAITVKPGTTAVPPPDTKH
jgi:hypothetical protein